MKLEVGNEEAMEEYCLLACFHGLVILFNATWDNILRVNWTFPYQPLIQQMPYRTLYTLVCGGIFSIEVPGLKMTLSCDH